MVGDNEGTDGMKKLDLLVTGVGGQGVILASDIVSEAALAVGYQAKKTDTLGMAQRGGSVISHVRVSPEVWSPLIKEGSVDMLLVFEKLEAARWSSYLSEGGIAIVNNLTIPPLAVSLGNAIYPSDEEIISVIEERTDQVYLVNGSSRAMEFGDVRALNMYMLGCASYFASLIEPAVWKESICRRLPAKVHEMNIEAFDCGRKEVQDACI